MAIELYTTNDQSHTLYNSELDETYHSRNGALEESLYVFLKQGFEQAALSKKTIRVLEVGFGTGLNAILTLQAAEASRVNCAYYSLETFPLPTELVQQLNYNQFISEQHLPHFQTMHTCAWNEWQNITPNFALCKAQQSIHTFKTDLRFDVVYFDAFGPDKQPDMWTKTVFENLFEHLNHQGIFVTYSAKGEVRRTLKAIGFDVELLPGPPRKRHMLRAIKP
jgi:tRNA U34 5-methylaminomethyl-2-thiouridine-forming methyltransferase MnmC